MMTMNNPVNKYPFHVREKCIVSAVNGLSIRMTDCKWTFDFMMKSLDHAISLMRNLSSHEMFEVLLKLDKSGIDNMNRHLFREWNTSKVGIWDYRNVKNTLKHITEKNKDE